jgi:hypothetical protein
MICCRGGEGQGRLLGDAAASPPRPGVHAAEWIFGVQGKDVRANKGSDPKKALKRILNQFREARKQLAQALEDEKKFDGLAAKREAKMPELRARALETWPEEAGPGINAGRLNRLIEDTPEQKEIESIRQRRRSAEREIQDRRAEARPPWARLVAENWTARTPLVEFDGLSRYSTLRNTDIIIGLLEGVLQSLSAPRQKPAHNRMTEVEERIREMKEAHFSTKEICDRLGNSVRPQGADWRDLPWPEAYERQKNSVSKFISLVGKKKRGLQ